MVKMLMKWGMEDKILSYGNNLNNKQIMMMNLKAVILTIKDKLINLDVKLVDEVQAE